MNEKGYTLDPVSIHAPVRGATAIIHRNILLFLYIMPKNKDSIVINN